MTTHNSQAPEGVTRVFQFSSMGKLWMCLMTFLTQVFPVFSSPVAIVDAFTQILIGSLFEK